ncbi:MAG: hypothetical protein R3E84_19405 [Pseudomonadales bacterium]
MTDWEADFLLFDMQRLAMCFDDADELIEEMTFGITKSLIALRRRRQGCRLVGLAGAWSAVTVAGGRCA